jgi:hypothetical protein
MSTPRPILTQPNRDAAPSVRGFVYQVDQTVLAWLALRDDEALFIELGEDFAIERKDPVALLEMAQIKDVSSNISLRTEDVIDAILNLADHRARNPGVSLQMDFLTSAGVATERSTTLTMPGLAAWERIAAGDPDEAALFNGVVGLLRKAKTTRHNELKALLANRGALLRPLIPLLRWRTRQPPIAALEAGVRSALVRLGHVVMPDDAVAAHDALFSHVFRQLADPAREPLRRQDIVAVMRTRETSLRQRYVEQERRMEYLVARQAYVEAILAFDPRNEILDLSSVLTRTDLPLFTGRADLIAKLHDLVPSGGLTLIQARAGGGKSSLMAYLHATNGWPAHFAELSKRTQDALRSLAAQIALEYDDDDWLHRLRNRQLDAPAIFWSELSALAGRVGRTIVVLVDGIDEMDEEAEFLRGSDRAPGVLCVVTRRTVDDLGEACRLTINDTANEADIAKWLPRRVGAERMRSRLKELGWTPEPLVQRLLERVGANWKYADAVVRTIEQSEQILVAIEDLPANLVDWYRLWWQQWRKDHEPTWYQGDLRLLSTLAVTAEPLTDHALAELSAANVMLTRTRVLVDWASFLVIDGRGRIRPDHEAFREFLLGRWTARAGDPKAERLQQELEGARGEADERILDWYLNRWGGLKAGLPGLRKWQGQYLHDGYGVRHLVRHAARIDDHSTLRDLLLLEWEEAGAPRSALELTRISMGDAPLFRDDLMLGSSEVAQRRRALDKLIRPRSDEPVEQVPPSAFELQLAFGLSSLHELRGAIVPGLARLAFRADLWSLEQILNHLRRLPASERAMGLAMLAAEKGVDRERLAQEALTAINEIREATQIFPVVRRLADVLSEPTRGQMLVEVGEYAMRLLDFGPAIALCHLGDVLSDEVRLAIGRIFEDRFDHTLNSAAREGILRWIPTGPVRERLLDKLLRNELNAPLVMWLDFLRNRICFVDPEEFEDRARADGLLDQLGEGSGGREVWSELLSNLSPGDSAYWLTKSKELPQIAKEILNERTEITDGTKLAAAMRVNEGQDRDIKALNHLRWLPVAARGGAAERLLSRLNRTPDPRSLQSMLDAIAQIDPPPREVIARLLQASRSIGDHDKLERARCALAWALPRPLREQLRSDAWAKFEAEAVVEVESERWRDGWHLLPVARQIHGLVDDERRQVVARLLDTFKDQQLDDETLGALLIGASTTEEDLLILPSVRTMLPWDQLWFFLDAAAGRLRAPDLAVFTAHLYELEYGQVRILAALARDRLLPSSFVDLWRGAQRWDHDTRAVLGAVLTPLAPATQQSMRICEVRTWIESAHSTNCAILAAALLAESTKDQYFLDLATSLAHERIGGQEAILARAILARLDVQNARHHWRGTMQDVTEQSGILEENLLLSELLRVPASQALPALEALTEVIRTTERSKTAGLVCAVSPWLAAIRADEFARSIVQGIDLAQRWWP